MRYTIPIDRHNIEAGVSGHHVLAWQQAASATDYRLRVLQLGGGSIDRNIGVIVATQELSAEGSAGRLLDENELAAKDPGMVRLGSEWSLGGNLRMVPRPSSICFQDTFPARGGIIRRWTREEAPRSEIDRGHHLFVAVSVHGGAAAVLHGSLEIEPLN